MGATHDTVFDLVTQPDGRLVAFGKAELSSGAIARYLPSGALDFSFNGSGKSLTVFPGSDSGFYTGAITPDGHLVAAGDTYSIVTGDDSVVARFDASGTPDPTFGGGSGVASFTPGGAGSTEDGLAVASSADGRLLIGGSAVVGGSWNMFVQRLDVVTVPDFVAGGADWTTGSNMFGACLNSVAGGASASTGPAPAASWTPDAGCPTSGSWNAVPASAGAGSKVAQSVVGATTTAQANLRFGFKVAANQPPGTYSAPIIFDVIAPNA